MIPPLSISYKKRIYSPNRILRPMKRVDWDPEGERNPQNRGKSKFEYISWDEATDIIAKEIKRVHDEYGPYAILCQADGHGETKVVHAPHGAQANMLDLVGGYTLQSRQPDSWEGWYWGGKHIWGNEPVGMQVNQRNLYKDIAEHGDAMLYWGCDLETTPWGWGGEQPSRMAYFLEEIGLKSFFISPDLNYTGAAHKGRWTPCVKFAPEAIYKRDDGLVIIDPEAAKGNKDILKACPYGEIYWNEELQTPQKCTGCAHLLDDGWSVPRCVDACCTGALRFGEEEDFAEELANAEVLKPECGTAPRVYYLNKPKRFVAATVVDIDADEVVIGANVSLLAADEDVEVASAETDELGDVFIENVEPGAYRLQVAKEGYLTQVLDVDLTVKDQAFPELQFFAEPVIA